MFDKFFKKPASGAVKRTNKAEVIRMPKMSDNMQYAIISKWLVKVGDHVKAGDILAEVETDKATMELETYEHGTILYLSVKEREKVNLNEVLAIIGNEGEEYIHLLKKQEAELIESDHSKDTSKTLIGIVGEVKMFAGEEKLENWLKCDGSLYDKLEMEELYTVIGNKYGEEGNKFRVPNLEVMNGVSFIICFQ